MLRTQAPWPAVLWEPHVEPVLIPGLIVGKSTPVAQSGSDGLQSFCSRGDPPNLGQPGLCVTVLYFKAERRKHLISLVSLVFWKKKKKKKKKGKVHMTLFCITTLHQWCLRNVRRWGWLEHASTPTYPPHCCELPGSRAHRAHVPAHSMEPALMPYTQ